MSLFSQIIKLKFKPAFQMDQDDVRECIIALGVYKETNHFLIKSTNFNDMIFQSKKYLKKSDKSEIAKQLHEYDYTNESVEYIDLTSLDYVKAMEEIDNKFLEMKAVFKQI